jgi:hypothetical protein
MQTIDDYKYEIVEIPNANTVTIKSQLARICVKVARYVFQPRYDPSHLSQHLRRDAGIDELELERETIARAPLIRLQDRDDTSLEF